MTQSTFVIATPSEARGKQSRGHKDSDQVRDECENGKDIAMLTRLTRLNWRGEAILDVYNLMLALFLAASPWLFAYRQGVMRTDAWLSSAVVLLLSIAAIVAFARWEEWANIAVGVWMIVSPWVLGFQHTHAMHISIAVGVLVAYLAAIELCLIHMHGKSTTARQSQR
jgi:hypothetical protein